MKKRIFCFSIPLLLLSCNGVSRSSDSSFSETESRDDAAPEVNSDSPANAAIPFEVKKYEKKKGDNELKLEYPVSGNPELLASVRNWINEQLSDTYRGNLDDSEAFFRHYAALLGTDPDLNEYGGYTIDEFEVEYRNDLIVTYDYTSYTYEGGAHGMGGSYGTTFLQSDGSIFDKDCITSYAPLHQLFIDGLKEYFKVKTDEQLLGCLIDVKSLAKLAPPGMKPWIEKDGVTFSYTPYEIAPYSSGSPRFTIPYSKIEPYLTEKGKKFF